MSMAEYDFETASGVVAFADQKLGSNYKTKAELDKINKESIANKLEKIEESEYHLCFRYDSTPSSYEVFLELQRNGNLEQDAPDYIVVNCTCPAAKSKQPHICKHGLAALLWRLSPDERLKITNPTPTPDIFATATATAATTAAPTTAAAPASHPSLPKRKLYLPDSLIKTNTTVQAEPSSNQIDKVSETIKEKKNSNSKNMRPPPPRRAGAVRRPERVKEFPRPRRWMNSAEMLALDDATIVAECKNVLAKLEEEEKITRNQQQQQQQQIEVKKQQQETVKRIEEEKKTLAPSAAGPVSMDLDTDFRVAPGTSTGAAGAQPPPAAAAAEDAGAAAVAGPSVPPAPPPIEDEYDEFSFHSMFKDMK